MGEPLRARTAVIVFGLVGGLMAAYLVWLIVFAPQSLQLGWFNGWVGSAFRLVAAVICVIGGLRRRPGSYVPLVFGLALIFTTIGNVILTVDSLHGPPPPPPTPADFFGLGTLVLFYIGIALMARRGSRAPEPPRLARRRYRRTGCRRGVRSLPPCASAARSGTFDGGCRLLARVSDWLCRPRVHRGRCCHRRRQAVPSTVDRARRQHSHCLPWAPHWGQLRWATHRPYNF